MSESVEVEQKDEHRHDQKLLQCVELWCVFECFVLVIFHTPGSGCTVYQKFRCVVNPMLLIYYIIATFLTISKKGFSCSNIMLLYAIFVPLFTISKPPHKM